MKEILVTEKTLPEAYHHALLSLFKEGDIVPCPDYNTNQKEISMTMCVEEPFKEPMISKLFMGGFYELEQYCEEMLDGILDFEVEKGNWKYTYHQRYEKQLPFIINELQRNPYSRRAVISIRTNDDIGSKDPACLQHLQFFIRENKIHCKVLFRSNDACKATFMNAFALIQLQKRIADQLKIEVGTYIHRANSFHCYEKDFKLLTGYVNRIQKNIDLTYDYKDEWEILMKSVQPDISKKIKQLKGEIDEKA